jgi:hypothetical protein
MRAFTATEAASWSFARLPCRLLWFWRHSGFMYAAAKGLFSGRHIMSDLKNAESKRSLRRFVKRPEYFAMVTDISASKKQKARKTMT